MRQRYSPKAKVLSFIVNDKKPTDAALLFFGVAALMAVIAFNPISASQFLSPDKILHPSTVIRILLVDAVLLAAGLGTIAYASLRIFHRPFAQWLESMVSIWTILLVGMVVLLSLLSGPFLIYDALRMGRTFPIDFNEGWNVFHTRKVIEGGKLYTSVTDFPVVPVNYPPLSFLIIGGLSNFTHDLLLTGRYTSYVALLVLAAMIFATVRALTGHTLASGMAALLFLALMVQMADWYVGMYDPQLLGQVFSMSALYLHSRWEDRLGLIHMCTLGVLVAVGLSVKHSLVAIPIALAIGLFARHRHAFFVFALAAGAGVGLVMLTVLPLGAGEFAGNMLVELDRTRSVSKMFQDLSVQFVERGMVVFVGLFGALLASNPPPSWLPSLVYFPVALGLGSLATLGAGVDVNAWFDFFISSSLVTGLLAARSLSKRAVLIRAALLAAVGLAFMPLALRLDVSLVRLLGFRDLEWRARVFEQDVKLLRSINGTVLVDEPLLAVYAGKEFLFDPFLGSQMIVSGRLPESLLSDAVRARRFAAIVLYFDLHKELASGRSGSMTMLNIRWPRAILQVMAENYELVDPQHPTRYFWYFPRNEGSTLVD
jgi:hypothetical protein